MGYGSTVPAVGLSVDDEHLILKDPNVYSIYTNKFMAITLSVPNDMADGLEELKSHVTFL
jgi:hypothetical protein